MNYAVLGSEGQIGSPLYDYLCSQGHRVWGIDWKNLNIDDLRFQEWNSRLEYDFYHDSFIDFVYFLAFDVGGSVYLKEYEKTKEFLDNNMKIMLNVFDFLDRHKIPFVFASTQMVNMPWSAYGMLKNIGEKYTKALGGLNVRLWNVYGVERELDKAHVITDLILSAAKDKVVRVRTNGNERRQFLHTDDCSEALYLLSNPELYKNCLNSELPICVSTFEWNTVRDIAEIIAKEFNCSIEYGGGVDEVQKGLTGEPDKTILCDVWKSRVSLEEGIKKVICEMKEKCLI